MTTDPRMPSVQRGREKPEKSIAELTSELYRQIGTMIDRQIALARQEASAAVRSAGRGAATLAVGGVLAQAAVVCLALAAVYRLREQMPPWAAASLVGASLGSLGVVAGAVGFGQLRRATGRLPEVQRQLREDMGWARDEARELAWELGG